MLTNYSLKIIVAKILVISTDMEKLGSYQQKTLFIRSGTTIIIHYSAYIAGGNCDFKY